MAGKEPATNELLKAEGHTIILTKDSLSQANQLPPASGAKPKAISTLRNATSVLTERLAAARAEESEADHATDEITMNWQGRYKALDKNSAAITPLSNLSADNSVSKTHSKVTHASSVPTDDLSTSNSQHDQNAMRKLFGEDLNAGHITMLATTKKVIARWRARAAQRKNVIAVEKFASNEPQKRAIVKHKEQAMINLPMPVVWAIKEEVLAVLSEVVKVYTKEFGSNHKLTVDARRRIEKLQADLARPNDN